MKNTTKFIKITTTHSKNQLEALMFDMSNVEVETLVKTYKKFKYVEFANEVGNECMYAVIHENYIPELLEIYVSLSLNFVYEDMSEEALYSSVITDNEDVASMLEIFINTIIINF